MRLPQLNTPQSGLRVLICSICFKYDEQDRTEAFSLREKTDSSYLCAEQVLRLSTLRHAVLAFHRSSGSQLFVSKNIHYRLARWLERWVGYRCEVVYLPGYKYYAGSVFTQCLVTWDEPGSAEKICIISLAIVTLILSAGLEPYYANIRRYIIGMEFDEYNPKRHVATKRKSHKVTLWGGKLYRRTKMGVVLVPLADE